MLTRLIAPTASSPAALAKPVATTLRSSSRPTTSPSTIGAAAGVERKSPREIVDQLTITYCTHLDPP